MEIRREKLDNTEYVLLPAPDSRGYETEMIARLSDPHILCPEAVYRDQERWCRYPVSGLKSLRDYASARPMPAADMRDLLLQLEQTENVLRRYMLSGDNLLPDPDLLFVEEETRCLKVLAVESGPEPRSVQPLIRLFFRSADVRDAETLRLAHAIGMVWFEESPSLPELYRAVYAVRSAETRAMAEEKPREENAEDAFLSEEDREPYPEAGSLFPEALREEGFLPGDQPETVPAPGPAGKLRALLSALPLAMIGIALAVMLAGLLLIFLIRGAQAARRVLPQFFLITGSVVAYIILKAREAPDGNKEEQQGLEEQAQGHGGGIEDTAYL